ncbi:MAG TPA: Fic family protein, partial [bacterium]|nr:Fic family protein [bacterium]
TFLTWFNDTAPDGKTPLPALTRAGISHLYFESIHPFEDGNGRKAKLYEKLRGRLNSRQEKTLERMFREGPNGFRGGLSAENYLAITKTSRATATRDLQDLVEIGALRRTGERKHTRYHLNIRL